jgi:hypothetical protein
MSFFDVMSEVQKDSQDVSAGKGRFSKNIRHIRILSGIYVEVSEVNFDLSRLN